MPLSMDAVQSDVLEDFVFELLEQVEGRLITADKATSYLLDAFYAAGGGADELISNLKASPFKPEGR